MGATQGWVGCSSSSSPTPQGACGAPRAQPHVSCFSSFRITRPSLDAGTSEPRGTHLFPVFIPFLCTKFLSLSPG